MKDMIEKIINKENVEEEIKLIMQEFYAKGARNSTYLEIISYLKLYNPELLSKYEEDILYLMGLSFKKDLKGSTNIKIELFKTYLEAINKKYDKHFTPVQANILTNIRENTYFSFSSATSTGKSFVFRKLIEEESGDIVIIVPSRALINEYYILINSMIKDKTTNILTFPDIINTEKAKRNIFILTPERSKELFRIKEKLNIKLTLFDEAQLGDEDSKRAIFFDSIIRRIKKNFPETKMLFAHPYIENPIAQLEKNQLVDSKYNAINYIYKNVGQIYTCIDKDYNYYHFGIEKEIMGNRKKPLTYDPIKKCIEDNGTVLIYTSKNSIYDGSILQHMRKYIELCEDLDDEKAISYINEVKELIGGSSEIDTFTYSNLLSLLKKGIVIHHGSLPLAVRIIIERFTQEGYCKLCFATSTLYQGINMPFDIVYIKRFEGSKNLLIKNLIGRAGRSTMKNEFDYGQIIVPKSQMSNLRNCLKEKNVLSNESLLDVTKETDDDDILEFKDAIKNNEYSDEYNMTNKQIERLNQDEIDEYIEDILDNLLIDNKFITSEIYNDKNHEEKQKIFLAFEKIYTNHLKNRELTDAEKEVLKNAILIFIWQINGKKFKEITGYRFSYITRQNDRRKIETDTKHLPEEIKEKIREYQIKLLEPRFTISATQLPNPTTPRYNMFFNMKISDVSYDLVVYDTYDYIDKVWGFSLMDVYYAAFDLYFKRTQDERSKIMAKYIKYSTIEDKEIWLIRYGFDFEDIEWIKPLVKSVNEKRIEFSDNIKDLDENKIAKIARFI